MFRADLHIFEIQMFFFLLLHLTVWQKKIQFMLLQFARSFNPSGERREKEFSHPTNEKIYKFHIFWFEIEIYI